MTDSKEHRSILFTSLGTSGYQTLNYEIQRVKQPTVTSTRFSQVARIADLAKSAKLDDVVLLSTSAATEANWNANGKYIEPEAENQFNVATDNHYFGLKRCIEELLDEEYISGTLLNNLADMDTPVAIQEGATIDEIWEIFDQIQQRVNAGDEIHLDITNGYRSIPVVMLLALDFVVKIKDAKLSTITYGAAESKNENGNTPIWDLSGFLEIREWSNAVDAFNRGDPRRFADLGKTIFKNEQVKQDVTQFSRELTQFGNCLIDCDAYGLKGAYINAYGRLLKLQSRITSNPSAHQSVFLVVLGRLKEELDKFNHKLIAESESLLPTMLGAIHWCLRANLNAQAIILIREACVRIVFEASGFSGTVSMKEADKLFSRMIWLVNTENDDSAQSEAVERQPYQGCEHADLLIEAEQKWLQAISMDVPLRNFIVKCWQISDARNSIAHAKEGHINPAKFELFTKQLEGWKTIVSNNILKISSFSEGRG